MLQNMIDNPHFSDPMPRNEIWPESTKTVEYHKRSIMDELGLRTTAELTRYAVKHGIVSL